MSETRISGLGYTREPLDSRRAGQTNLPTRCNSEELELREHKWICDDEIAKRQEATAEIHHH